MVTEWYAGVGSRTTPERACRFFTHLAGELEADGFGLQSGGAEGADLAFESGVVDAAHARIFVPWPTFGRGLPTYQVLAGPVLDRCVLLASVAHPAWGACKSPARLLHARNVAQIWGPDLASPVKFVLCWAEEHDGEVVGGTRTAVVLARAARHPGVQFRGVRHASALRHVSRYTPRRVKPLLRLHAVDATPLCVRGVDALPWRERIMTFKPNTESGIRPDIVLPDGSVLRSLPWGGRQYLSMGVRKWAGGYEAVNLHPGTLEPFDDQTGSRFARLADTLAWIRYQTAIVRRFFWDDEPEPQRPAVEPLVPPAAPIPAPKRVNRSAARLTISFD